MVPTIEVIDKKIRRLSEVVQFCQKEDCVDLSLSKVTYSHIVCGKVVPAISAIGKLVSFFEVNIAQFFHSNDLEQELNLPLMEKIKTMYTLGSFEQQALFKLIDLA